MEKKIETLYMIKDFEVVIKSDSLTASSKSYLTPNQQGTCPISLANIIFSKANSNVRMVPAGQRTPELTAVQKIFQEYASRNQNRIFAWFGIKQEPVLNASTNIWEYELRYSVGLNQNLLKSLAASSVFNVQANLQCFMEEMRSGKWCQWSNMKYSLYQFETSISQVKGTASDDILLRSSKKIDKELEALEFIRQDKSNLRIRFNVDIFANYARNVAHSNRITSKPLSTTNSSPSLPNPLKLTENSILQALYENNHSKDVTIIGSGGVRMKAHRLILTAHSAVLEAMLTSKTREGVSFLFLEDIGEAAMKQLLRYFYGMEVPLLDLNCETACELFKAAHKYKLKQMEDAIASLFLFRNENWFSADIALELYFYSKNIEAQQLNEHLLCVLSRIPSTKLRSSRKFQELPSSDVVDLSLKLNDMLNLHL